MPHIINGVQCRTREESLKHIIEQAKLGKIGPKSATESGRNPCLYQYPSGNHCALGSLFSDKQIRDIKHRGLNESSVAIVACDVGQANVEAVTGMKFQELLQLQKLHDRAVESSGGFQRARIKVIEYCQDQLMALKKTA